MLVQEMLDIWNQRRAAAEAFIESYEVVGNLKPEIAEELGLGTDVKVIAGLGDNAAAAVKTGTVGDGQCNISLGLPAQSLYQARRSVWISTYAAFCCTCRRQLSSDRMYAQCGILQ